MSVLPLGTDGPDPLVRRAASDLNDAAQQAHESLPGGVQAILDAIVQGRPSLAQTLINNMMGDLVALNAIVSRAAGHQMREAGRRAATTGSDMPEHFARQLCRQVSELMLTYNGHVGGAEAGNEPYGEGQPLRGKRS